MTIHLSAKKGDHHHSLCSRSYCGVPSNQERVQEEEISSWYQAQYNKIRDRSQPRGFWRWFWWQVCTGIPFGSAIYYHFGYRLLRRK